MLVRWWRISKKRTMVFRKISQSSQSVQFRRPNEKYRRRTYCRTDVDKPGIRSTSFVRQLSSDHSTSYTVVRRRCRSSRGECLVLLLQQWESETAHHKKRTCVSPFASIHRRDGTGRRTTGYQSPRSSPCDQKQKRRVPERLSV